MRRAWSSLSVPDEGERSERQVLVAKPGRQLLRRVALLRGAEREEQRVEMLARRNGELRMRGELAVTDELVFLSAFDPLARPVVEPPRPLVARAVGPVEPRQAKVVH